MVMPDNFFYNVTGSSFNGGNHICNCYHIFALNSCTGVQNVRLGGFKLIIEYSRKVIQAFLDLCGFNFRDFQFNAI